jgi:hypothetical protein
MRFKNNLTFAPGCSHEYDERFDKIGDSYTLRDGAQFIANDGADITSQIQDVTENSKVLQIDTRKNVAFQFTSKDLTLTIDRFAERYLDGASIALANKFETDGLTKAYQTCPNLVGTPGTTPATAAVILAAGRKLDEAGAPMDNQRNLILNPAGQASMVDALKGLFQSSSEIGKQYKSGRMGTAFGFDWAMSQNIRTHTLGTWVGTPLLNGVPAQGATTIAVDGLTGSATIAKGDKFTLAGVYAVNPVTGDAYDYLRQFTVLAAATASSGAIASLSIYPAIKSTGPGATVSALPADDAALVEVGTGSTAYPMNIAFHKHAFVYASVPLVVPNGVHFGKTVTDPDTGLSVRVVSAYNVLTDVFVTRCDIAYGWKERRPEWASVIIG